MRGLAIVVVTVLGLLPSMASAEAAPTALDRHALDLAREVAAKDGDQTEYSNTVRSLEPALELIVVKAVGVTDPAKSAKIGGVIRDNLQELWGDLFDIRVSAIAQTYAVQELEQFLAFHRSQIGEAYDQAAPALSRDLLAALGSNAPDTGEPLPSDQKLSLINRILTARDVANDARNRWRMLNAGQTQIFSVRRTNAAITAPPANDQAGEDAFVGRIVAIEIRFYAKTFSSEQLAELAAYFEGPVGRASAAGGPRLASIMRDELPEVLERRFERIDQEVCEAVTCVPDQKAALEAQVDVLMSAMTAVEKSSAH